MLLLCHRFCVELIDRALVGRVRGNPSEFGVVWVFWLGGLRDSIFFFSILTIKEVATANCII